jgi:hypothetical protein
MKIARLTGVEPDFTQPNERKANEQRLFSALPLDGESSS